MRSLIGLSIVTTTLLVILGTLFLFWTPTSHKDMTATVINTPALASEKPPEPELVTEPTTTEVSTPTEITTATQEDVTAPTKPPTKTTEVTKVVPPPTPSQPADLVTILHSLSNTSRGQRNLADLTFDTKLSALAKERSQEMIDQHYFSHTSPDGCDLRCRFTNANYETFSWGENLAESTSYQMLSNRELAEMFMESWLKSSGHRDNLLSAKFTHEGIGVAVKSGRVVVTVIFATPQVN